MNPKELAFKHMDNHYDRVIKDDPFAKEGVQVGGQVGQEKDVGDNGDTLPDSLRHPESD